MGADRWLAALIVLALLVWLAQQTRVPDETLEAIELPQVLGAPDSGERFERITGPQPLSFPADHASHDGYRNEWWYFTGRIDGPEGRSFGFQFTLFRFNLGPLPPVASAWSSSQLWMAHLALSDLDEQRFSTAERFARGALGLAGATAERWWLDDWQVTTQDEGWLLRASTSTFDIDLELRPDRPLVLQGLDGYSQKGPAPGQASRYYAHTRLRAEGRVRTRDWSGPVTGLAWLDREWGSGQLDEGLQGWDWFALHLDDGRDLMLYRLRHHDGTMSPFSAGALVDPSGGRIGLSSEDFSAEAVEYWRDERGIDWPIAWRLQVPGADLDLSVRAVFPDQLWRESIRYWEGAVDAQDRRSRLLIGRGYMELSGYGNAALRGQRQGSTE
ncbi:lipocalin-like domain-containing protein [Wenzhouxiangella marina]|nr:lipocalin-like domain-containing protein [Wenzhouxiangella marina]MBB6087828.1 putative secreted hydrolase [Wenzhouxiangella marina]